MTLDPTHLTAAIAESERLMTTTLGPLFNALELWRAEVARNPRPTDAEVALANAFDAILAQVNHDR